MFQSCLESHLHSYRLYMTVAWHTPDISWILMISPTGGYHVGTMWVPCGTTWCQCQAARSPVPQCRCCAAWNCRGSKVSRLGCHMGMGQNLLNMWFFRDDHQPWGSLGVQGLTHIHILLHILYLSDLSDLSCHVAEAWHFPYREIMVNQKRGFR